MLRLQGWQDFKKHDSDIRVHEGSMGPINE